MVSGPTEPEISPEAPLPAMLLGAAGFAGEAALVLVADSGAEGSAARNALVIEDLRLSMNTPRPPTSAAAQAPMAINFPMGNFPMGNLPIGWLADFFVAYVGLGEGVDAAVGKEFDGEELGGRELLGSPQSNESRGLAACFTGGVGVAGAAALICNCVPHLGHVIFLPAIDSFERRVAPHGQRNCTDIREVLRKAIIVLEEPT